MSVRERYTARVFCPSALGLRTFRECAALRREIAQRRVRQMAYCEADHARRIIGPVART